MPRREKTPIAAKRQHVVVPMAESMDPRAIAKHPIQHRGDSTPPRKRTGRKPGR